MNTNDTKPAELTDALPQLPIPAVSEWVSGRPIQGYTADQMRGYARWAVEQAVVRAALKSAPAVDAATQPVPLTDEQWLKLRTSATGVRLRRTHDDAKRADFLRWMRFAERAYSIGAPIPPADDETKRFIMTGAMGVMAAQREAPAAPLQEREPSDELDDARERAYFERWAGEEWGGRPIPDNAWLGWKARAALSAKPQPEGAPCDRCDTPMACREHEPGKFCPASEGLAPALSATRPVGAVAPFYLVLAPNGLEGVAFRDKKDADYTATGRMKGGMLGCPAIGEAFREAYEDTDSFETAEVYASPPVAAVPFLSARADQDEVLAAAMDLDHEVREIANGKRKAGKLSLHKLAIVISVLLNKEAGHG